MFSHIFIAVIGATAGIPKGLYLFVSSKPKKRRKRPLFTRSYWRISAIPALTGCATSFMPCSMRESGRRGHRIGKS
jgi:hypothetical protein